MSCRLCQHVDYTASSRESKLVSLLLRLPNAPETLGGILPRASISLQVFRNESSIRATDDELFGVFANHTSSELDRLRLRDLVDSIAIDIPDHRELIRTKICACAFVLLSDLDLKDGMERACSTRSTGRTRPGRMS